MRSSVLVAWLVAMGASVGRQRGAAAHQGEEVRTNFDADREEWARRSADLDAKWGFEVWFFPVMSAPISFTYAFPTFHQNLHFLYLTI
jgi:hypothetical protein